jgi:hypothetical protein
MRRGDFYKDYQNFQLLVNPVLFPAVTRGDGTAYAPLNLNGYYDIRLENFTGFSRSTYPGSTITYPAILQSSLFSSAETVIPGFSGYSYPLTAFSGGALFIPTQDFELDYEFKNVYINGGFYFKIGQGTPADPYNIHSSLWQTSSYNPAVPAWNNNSNVIVQFSYRPAKVAPQINAV